MLLSELIIKIFLYVFWGFVALNMIAGFINGGRKAGVRLFFQIISVILSVILTIVLSDVFKVFVESLIAKIDLQMLTEVFQASPSLVEYIYALIVALCGPILFLILYFALSGLMLIPGIFVNKAFKQLAPKNEEGEPTNGILNRVIGLIVGALCGVVVASSIFTPFVGYMVLADQVYSEVTEKELVVENETVNLVFNNIHDAQASKLIAFETKFTSPLFNICCKVRTESGTSSIMDEVSLFSSIVVDALKFVESSTNESGDTFTLDVDSIDSLVDSACRSQNLKAILAEILSSASTKWSNNEAFLSINLKEMISQSYGDDLDGAINILLEDFTKTTASTVDKDIKTLTATVKTAFTLVESLEGLVSNNVESLVNINTDKLEDALNTIDSNQKLKDVLAIIIAKAGSDWLNGDLFLGFNPNTIEGVPSDFANALKVIYNEFATTNSTTVCQDLRNFAGAINVIGDVFDKITKLNFDSYESINITEIDGLIDSIGENLIVKKVVATVVSDAGTAWLDGNTFANINIKESLPENYNSVFDKNLTQFKSATENNVVQVLQTFSDTVKAFKYIINLANNADSDSLQEDMENFVICITPDNIDILKETINSDILVDVGINGTDAPVVEELFGSALENISQMEPEEKTQEAEALNKLFIYSQELQEGNNVTVSNQEMIDTVIDSKALSQSVVDYAESGSTQTLTVNEEEKTEISNALVKYEQGTEEEQRVAESLKKLFGIN